MDTLVVLSDQQARWHDRRTEQTVLRFLADFQPDLLVNLGDLFDFEAVGRFRKTPEAKRSIMADWSAGRAILKRQREVLTCADIVLVEGNHEARLQNYLMDNAEALFGVPSLRTAAFLGLDDFGVRYIEPYGQGLDWHGVLLYHGSRMSPHSAYTAAAEYRDAGTSGISGHTHRLGTYYHTDRAGQHVWLEAGCLCNVTGPHIPPSYRGPRVQNWQQGFTVGYYDSRHWTLYQVCITGHQFIWNGKLYKP